MKILWVTHEGHLSGANICLLEYINVLQEMGYEQQIILPSFGNGEFVQIFDEKKIPVLSIPYYSWATELNKPDRFWQQLRKKIRNHIAVNSISKIIKKFNPDFVATNTIVVPVGAYAAKNMKRKHIWFIHEFGEEDHGFTIAGKFSTGAKKINALSEKVVFNSLIIKKKFSQFIDAEKQFDVRYPVNINSGKIISLSQVSESFKLIMVGQIAPSKNQLDAIKALVICRSKGLDVVLKIIGKAEDEKYLEQIKNVIAKNDAEKYVHFTGTMKGPVNEIMQSHALLMCSRMEAFGRVTVEALKCGIPVIAANKGGSLEIVQDGVNGYFYNSGDVEDLAGAIFKLYNSYLSFDKEKIATTAKEKFNDQHSAVQLQKVFS